MPEDAKEILLSNPLFFGATMVRVEMQMEW